MAPLDSRCTKRRRILAILALVASIAYAALVFRPEIGCLLVRLWTAATVVLLGTLYYHYLTSPCQRVRGEEEYRDKYLKAPVG